MAPRGAGNQELGLLSRAESPYPFSSWLCVTLDQALPISETQLAQWQ